MGAFPRSIVLAAASLVVPGLATAQLCLGVPAADGAVALAARAGIAWDETTYDGGATVNLPGPLSVSGAYSHGMLYPLHRPANGVSAGLAYEVSRWGMSVCPVANAQYERLSISGYDASHTYSWTTLSLGVTLGRTLASWREAYLVAHGGPRLIYFRSVYRDEVPRPSADGPEGSPFLRPPEIGEFHEFGGHAGLTLGRGRLYLDAVVAGTSHGRWEPAYTLSLGVVLGGEDS
jgi:hypothetical protein